MANENIFYSIQGVEERRQYEKTINVKWSHQMDCIPDQGEIGTLCRWSFVNELWITVEVTYELIWNSQNVKIDLLITI